MVGRAKEKISKPTFELAEIDFVAGAAVLLGRNSQMVVDARGRTSGRAFGDASGEFRASMRS